MIHATVTQRLYHQTVADVQLGNTRPTPRRWIDDILEVTVMPLTQSGNVQTLITGAEGYLITCRRLTADEASLLRDPTEVSVRKKL